MSLVGHLNGVCRKRKPEHGSASRSTKELFAAMLSIGWSIAMPSAKPCAEKKRVRGTAQVDKLDATDIKILVCVPLILCSLVFDV